MVKVGGFVFLNEPESVGVASQMLHEQDAIVEDTSTDVPIGQLG